MLILHRNCGIEVRGEGRRDGGGGGGKGGLYICTADNSIKSSPVGGANLEHTHADQLCMTT